MNLAIITWWSNSEREVSLRSWAQVDQALKILGHHTHFFDFPHDLPVFLEDYKHLDGAFIMVHGMGGEDGQIAHFLQTLWVPFQCTSPKTLNLTINKRLTKLVRKQCNIPIARDHIVRSDYLNSADITWPCVIKALTEGSSVGVWICRNQDQFDNAIQQAQVYNEVLIEEFLEGREVTVAIIDSLTSTQPIVFPVVEIIPPVGEEFDYENKYNGKSQEICPADFEDNQIQIIQDIALQAYQAVWCTQYARIDIIVTKDGPKCLEINTIPGFTDQSLFPKAAQAYGRPFPQLIQHLLDLMIHKQATNKKHGEKLEKNKENLTTGVTWRNGNHLDYTEQLQIHRTPKP